ncbi:granzyme G-like [Lampris incognitus]|uniref:granzyme G-like n=1 Tax=Lampris incognitus TaxID=2546036 RepID=UPI0024B58A23|nr:granzyme G-like [Lampris incognitus]
MMHGLHKPLLFLAVICLGRKALGSEIINGEEAKKNSLKYMASVQHNGKHVCGGLIVSNDFVITAAHCDKGEMTVVLGTHNIKRINEKQMRHKVMKCKHPSFKDVGHGNDIMLLKLSRRVKLGKSLKTVNLPNPGEIVEANTKCHVAGWGLTERGSGTDKLRVANVSTIDLELCQREWIRSKLTLPPNIICAGGYKTDKGACQGDSGGPLVCNNKAVGIVSFNLNKNCNYSNLPNIYTDISKFLPWIKNILKRKKCV